MRFSSASLRHRSLNFSTVAMKIPLCARWLLTVVANAPTYVHPLARRDALHLYHLNPSARWSWITTSEPG